MRSAVRVVVGRLALLGPRWGGGVGVGVEEVEFFFLFFFRFRITVLIGR